MEGGGNIDQSGVRLQGPAAGMEGPSIEEFRRRTTPAVLWSRLLFGGQRHLSTWTLSHSFIHVPMSGCLFDTFPRSPRHAIADSTDARRRHPLVPRACRFIFTST